MYLHYKQYVVLFTNFKIYIKGVIVYIFFGYFLSSLIFIFLRIMHIDTYRSTSFIFLDVCSILLYVHITSLLRIHSLGGTSKWFPVFCYDSVESNILVHVLSMRTMFRVGLWVRVSASLTSQDIVKPLPIDSIHFYFTRNVGATITPPPCQQLGFL